jgi:hypothetical protein
VEFDGQGTYPVDKDCTGQMGIGSDVGNFVFVDNRKEVYATHVTSGLVTTFVFNRIIRHR